MEICVDFFNWLDYDSLMKLLMCLEDPSDLVRVSSVSRSCRHFVIANGLCKQLCFRMFPSLHRVDHIIEANCGRKNPSEVGCSKSMELETLEREHRVYACFAQSCTSFALRECISEAISASSTDNYPRESIDNTLEPGERVARRYSYWSSEGQSNAALPETLTYKLGADICVITEISVQPFQAFFQWGSPIYSAKSVRFRMGHAKAPVDDLMGESCDSCAGDNFIWTCTSPEFEMAQENRLQNFKLPEPVLCIGGILQVELLGRVQRQQTDGLFYICVSHVKVTGRPLSPGFSVKILEPSGQFVLKSLGYMPPRLPENGSCPSPDVDSEAQERGLGQIVNLLPGEEELDEEMAVNLLPGEEPGEEEWDEEMAVNLLPGEEELDEEMAAEPL